MADIELVIKIDEGYLKDIKECVESGDIDYEPWVAIANGTPLPKGHGDLIDRKELLKQPMNTANYPSNYVNVAPTIVEAD